jgi:hypothetical protein
VIGELGEDGVTLFEGVTVDLPEIVVFENDQLATASEVLDFVDTIGWFFPLVALVLIVAALVLATDRRRAAAGLGYGAAIAVLANLAILSIIRAGTIGAVEDETVRTAGEQAWDTTLRFFTQASWALIVLGSIVGFVAWILGPSERPARLRAWWDRLVHRWRDPEKPRPTSGFAGFLWVWKRLLQWGAVVLGLLFIFIGPEPSGMSVIITTLVVVAVVGAIEAVAGPGTSEEAVDEAAEPEAAVTPPTGDGGTDPGER